MTEINGKQNRNNRHRLHCSLRPFLFFSCVLKLITLSPLLFFSCVLKLTLSPLLFCRWVSCKDMAAKSCTAVRDGTLEIIPKEFEPVWFRWLENIRDWCISRQLWWGHRIPAYYVTLEGEAGESGSGGSPGMPSENMQRWVVGRTEEEARRKAEQIYPGKALKLTQDEDVLDTWSVIWTLA
jgi:valyl-tRNA synthetase